jgi:hypothetical protein
VGAWLGVALAVLAPLPLGLALVGRLRRRARPLDEAPWPGLLSRLAGALQLARPVRLLLSADPAAMPMAVGLARPAILLPGEAGRWDEEKRRVVLLHELAHVRRRDCLTHALARLACALYWFNPLAWLALRRMRIERERACDDLVLSAGPCPSAYAAHLLEIARTMRVGALTSAAAIAMARPSQLEGRLRAILDATRNRKALRWGTLILGVLLLLLITIPLGMLKLGEQRVFSQMSPQARLDFERWYTQKVTIPPEALKIQSFEPQTVQAAREFYRLWKNDKDAAEAIEKVWWPKMKKKADQKEKLIGEFVAQHQGGLGSLAPLLAAARAVVVRPDYTLDAWGIDRVPSTSTLEMFPRLDYVTIRLISRLLYIDALIALKENRLENAIQDADALVAFARVRPYSVLVSTMIAVAILKTGMDVSEQIAGKITDPALRKRLLDNLERRRSDPPSIPDDDFNTLIQEHISMTAEARRLGVSYDFSNKTGYEIMLEWQRILAEHLEKIVLPTTTDPAKKKVLTTSIQDLRGELVLLSPHPAGLRKYLARWTVPINAATLYSISAPGFAKPREQMAKILARYDQLLADLKKDSPKDSASAPLQRQNQATSASLQKSGGNVIHLLKSEKGANSRRWVWEVTSAGPRVTVESAQGGAYSLWNPGRPTYIELSVQPSGDRLSITQRMGRNPEFTGPTANAVSEGVEHIANFASVDELAYGALEQDAAITSESVKLYTLHTYRDTGGTRERPETATFWLKVEK